MQIKTGKIITLKDLSNIYTTGKTKLIFLCIPIFDYIVYC